MEVSEHSMRRKLKVLVITLGGHRQQKIEAMFSDPMMAEHFEMPTFSEGISSRYIRNRFNFFKVANDAGLLPEEEWQAILESTEDKRYEGQPTERFFDCLEGIEVTKGRHGSEEDVKLHYTVELWRKAKAINRSRSVLACVFAHLIAMKKFVEDRDFDLILEDNVRTDPKRCAQKVWECMSATREWEEAATNNSKCHFLFFGWLGSIPNLQYILNTHMAKRKHARKSKSDGCTDNDDLATTCPIPRLEHLEEDKSILDNVNNESNFSPETRGVDKEEQRNRSKGEEAEFSDTTIDPPKQHQKPGGNLLWGAYAYWISKDAYESLMRTLRSDVGAILWKGKRMRNYSVKPIDKILPRQTLSKFGVDAVQISSHPAFFRAPMLTSKIHTQWDPGFCDSTEYQLQATKLDWTDLWLTEMEREIVDHHKLSGKWLTISELESLRRSKTTMPSR